jgi:hypothetical protein
MHSCRRSDREIRSALELSGTKSNSYRRGYRSLSLLAEVCLAEFEWVAANLGRRLLHSLRDLFEPTARRLNSFSSKGA